MEHLGESAELWLTTRNRDGAALVTKPLANESTAQLGVSEVQHAFFLTTPTQTSNDLTGPTTSLPITSLSALLDRIAFALEFALITSIAFNHEPTERFAEDPPHPCIYLHVLLISLDNLPR